MARRHLVVLKSQDGSVEGHPMKEWLRRNPQDGPHGTSVTESTSHQLRNALRRKGWAIRTLPDKVLLVRPDEDGDTKYADLYTGSEYVTESTPVEEGVAESEDITFELEANLQAVLRANIEQLEVGLKIIDEGKERVTEAGRVDITAIDPTGTVVIIELKPGTAASGAVAQILAYMTAIAESDRKPVRGLLVAGDFEDRVVLAARAVPNLKLQRYLYRFSFQVVE